MYTIKKVICTFFMVIRNYPLDKRGSLHNIHNHPIGKLNDVEILGVHYQNFEQLKSAWHRRAKRINYENIFIIATDLELKKSEFELFDLLPYPKVCFTSRQDYKYDWMCYCPEFKDSEYAGDTLNYINALGLRIFEKNFDCISWLNNLQK